MVILNVKVLEARSIAETRGSYNSMMPTHVPLQQGRMGMPQVYQVSTAGLSSSLPIRLPGNQTMPGTVKRSEICFCLWKLFKHPTFLMLDVFNTVL